MKKIYFTAFSFIVSIVLIGCTGTSEHEENANDGVVNEEVEDNNNEKDSEEDVEEEVDETVLHTGSTETVMREIEGMEEGVDVINYEITPYNISYQLDESFGAPVQNANQFMYKDLNDIAQISLEILEQTSLDEAVSSLQEQFESEGYDEKGVLEDTPLEENGLQGKMQSYYDPVKGFYVYEMEEHVFAIKYEYPVEAADGMGPLMYSLRKSLQVK